MTDQTKADLVRIEDIISQRRYELADDKASAMEGVSLAEPSSVTEKVGLMLLHAIVRALIR